MRMLLRALLTGLFCGAIALGAVYWLIWADQDSTEQLTAIDKLRAAAASNGGPAPIRQPESRNGQAVFKVSLDAFEDGGFGTASRYMSPIQDRESLPELRQAVRERGRRGIAALRKQHEALPKSPPSTRKEALERIDIEQSLGLLYMYEGEFDQASTWIGKALATCRAADIPASVRSKLTALMGIIALRQGEMDNCLACIGPSSCIFPIVPEAVHEYQNGSREAVRWFNTYLDEWPGDLRVIWLLNIAYMTLGEYPDQVPKDRLIPVRLFRSSLDVGRFRNVALQVGLGRGGRTSPVAVSSTTSPATACPTSSPRRSTPTWGRRCSSIAATAPSRIDPRRPGWPIRSMRSTSAGPTSTTMETWMSCSSEAPGRSRPGSRCSAIRGAASSRTSPRPAAWMRRSPRNRPHGAITTTTAGSTSSSAANFCLRAAIRRRRPGARQPLPALSQPGRWHVRGRRRRGGGHERALRQGIGVGRLRRRRPP